MHTVFDDDEKIFQSLEAGADGYLLKNTSPVKLYEAIKDVTLGSAPISPGVQKGCCRHFIKNQQNFDLSPRENKYCNCWQMAIPYKKLRQNVLFQWIPCVHYFKKYLH